MPLFHGVRGPDLFLYGPLAEPCASEVPALTCNLVREANDGRLKVDLAGDRDANRPGLLPQRRARDTGRDEWDVGFVRHGRSGHPYRCLGVKGLTLLVPIVVPAHEGARCSGQMCCMFGLRASVSPRRGRCGSRAVSGGIPGEYTASIHAEVHRRPVRIEKQRINVD